MAAGRDRAGLALPRPRRPRSLATSAAIGFREPREDSRDATGGFHRGARVCSGVYSPTVGPPHGVYDFFFARCFATSRAVSMKSCATGLIVRFFRVTTPTGMSAIAGLTGKTLISGCWLENRNMDA